MAQPEPDSEPIQTYVAPSLKRKLEKVASSEDRSLAAYVRRVLEQHAKGIK
jgi:predicted HicB family RNase H-like nuclease